MHENSHRSNIPKLDFGSSSERSEEPVYKIAKSSPFAFTNRSSSSTVSWGTESLSGTPRITSKKEPYPPIKQKATISPVQEPKQGNLREIVQKGSIEKTDVKKVHSLPPDALAQHRWDNVEDIVCHNTQNMSPRKTSQKIKNSAVRAEEAVAASTEKPEQERRSPTSVHSSYLAWQPDSTLKQSLSFNARLCVFDPSDLSTCIHLHTSHGVSWRNSTSSWNLRSFIGKAFLEDSTWMLTEKHRTGASTSDVIFLPRAVHCCAYGSSTGRPYLPEVDIFPGSTLFVRYDGMDDAPESLRRFLTHTRGVLRIRICTVDNEKRKHALEEEMCRQQVPKDMWISIIAKLQVAHFPIEPGLHIKLAKLQAIWRNALRRKNKPVEAYVNLYKHYRLEFKKHLCYPTNMPREEVPKINAEVVSRAVLEEGLCWFQLPQLHPKHLSVVWDVHQATSGYQGPVHFSDFLHLIFGELPDCRRQLITEVFLKMDTHQVGRVKLTDLGRFYNEPRWVVKEFGSRLTFSTTDFVNIFEQFVASEMYVDFSEFEAFYEGLSIALAGCAVDSIINDPDVDIFTKIFESYGGRSREETDEFERLVRGCWGL